MHFDLIQSISLAGNAAIANDDRAGAGDALAWVIDGATDLGRPGLLGGRGGAAWIAMEANAALAAAGDGSIAAITRAMMARIARRFEAQRRREPVSRWELPVASFLAAKLEDGALHCAWLGDCSGLLGGPDRVERIGPSPDGKQAEAERAASMAGHGLGSLKARPGPIIAELRASRERPGRHTLGVDPLDPVEPGLATFACAPGDSLLLMTDGFAALVESYAAFDEAGLLAALPEIGLAGLAARLRAIEAEDSDCTRFPRFKRSDDATAIWLRIAV